MTTQAPLIDRGIRITATLHAPLDVTVSGRPGHIAIVDESGQVVASGRQVGLECAAVLQQAVERYWQCRGWLTVDNGPDTLRRAERDLAGAMSTAGADDVQQQ